ncbi:MAG: hypothetical protein ACI9DC_002444 [Gammaproteobacteria bacterium]|jgi:hypothetical protein
MQLASLVNSALPQRAEDIAGALRAWTRGQTLDATVLRAGNGQALLQVNGQQVLAQTRSPLVVGQALRLQVDKPGGQPQLRVLNGEPSLRGSLLLLGTQGGGATAVQAGAASAQSAGVANAVSRAMSSALAQTTNSEALAAAILRGALPHRQFLPQSMQALQQFVMAPRSAPTQPALERARAMAADLLQALPRPEDATDARRLRAMVQRSGLFHDSELARQERHQQQLGDDGSRRSLLNPPAADLKARLMAVADSLASAMKGSVAVDPRTEQAAAALRGAVANIEANQVVSVRASEQASGQANVLANTPVNAQGNTEAATWRMDLPVVDANGHQALQLRVDREPRGGSDNSGDTAWIARITIQPPGHEPVHARIALNGDAVYATFSTTDEALAQRIERGETQLRELLDVVHLALGGMRCLAAEPSHGNEDMPQSALVSEHA